MTQIFLTNLLLKLADEIGATVILAPDPHGPRGLIRFKHGQHTFFNQSQLELNSLGAAAIARDKACAAFILQGFGYRVPEGKLFRWNEAGYEASDSLPLPQEQTLAAGYDYALSLGLPVIVKPNQMSLGAMVAKVTHCSEYDEAARTIFSRKKHLLIQRWYPGNDYRVLVVDGQVAAAYQRVPLRVVGNGQSTIRALFAQHQQDWQAVGREVKLTLADPRILHTLQQSGWGLESIPADQQIVYLLSNANLSTGGDAIDLTAEIHQDFARLATNICKDMHLRMGGVDLLAADLTQPLEDYVVLEVNRSPGLAHFASLGEQQRQRVEEIYRRILRLLEAEVSRGAGVPTGR